MDTSVDYDDRSFAVNRVKVLFFRTLSSENNRPEIQKQEVFFVRVFLYGLSDHIQPLLPVAVGVKKDRLTQKIG